MAKIKIPFNNKNYSVDEQSLSSASDSLKSHLSTTMSGTGATINLNDTVYNVDSAKLLAATNDFISHLGLVAGDGYKVIVNGTEYSVASDKVAGAVSELEIVLGGLVSGGDNGHDDNDDNSNNTIQWNTQDVVGNLSFSTEDMVIVKVSDTILSHEELQASSFVVDSYSYPCETVWHINENVILALYGDMICISASAIGDVPEFGVTIPETGIYTLDIATMMGVNVDCKIVVLPIPDAPQSPTAFEITENSITLNEIEGCEYSIDGYNWQDSPIFDNLQSGHKYTFYIRYKGTASNAPSTISSSDIYVDGYVDLAIGSQHIEWIGYTNEDEELIIPDIFICEEQNCRFRVTGIQHSGFYGFTNMKSITIPSSVTSIGESAFRDCTNLTNVVIPNTITNVGRYAFYNCSNLLTVCFNNNNDNGQISTTIGEFAFCDCYKLETVTLPNNLVVLNRGLFFNCESLKNIVIPNSVTSIDSECFQRCKSLTSIAIPDLITMIGYNCFYSCNSLENVTFGKNSCLTDIGGFAFRSCNNLSNIVLPNSVSNIGNDAFGYTNLENIIIPNGVSNLGEDVFQHCTNLSNITIHDNVVSIGRSALYGCNKLTTITIPSSVTTIGQNALGYCTLLSNIIFKGTVEQWNEIEKDAAIHDTLVTEIVCSNGTIAVNFT